LSIAVQVAQYLPFLRRFARALTGSQAEGDDQVVRLLEALLADSTLLASDLPIKVALYRVFVRTRRDAINRLKTLEESGKLVFGFKRPDFIHCFI
jgi:DNA-directed RNA polymerase specialized sigma24 family protein